MVTKESLSPPDLAGELRASIYQIPFPDGWRTSPDAARQLQLRKDTRRVLLTLYNCAYLSLDKQRGPTERTTLMSLFVTNNTVSIELQTYDRQAPHQSTATYYAYPAGIKESGGKSWGDPKLVGQSNRDCLPTQEAPGQIDVAATARKFVAQIQDPNPEKRFATPVLVLPDGSVRV